MVLFFEFPAFKPFSDVFRKYRFPGISTFLAHVSWHSRKVKILVRIDTIVIAKNSKGQVASTQPFG